MILLADSGSTKTNWYLIKTQNEVIDFDTNGYNPFFCSEDYIFNDLKNSFPKHIFTEKVERVIFYGAGCNDSKMQNKIYNPIKKLFLNAEIQVESDIMAASIALFGNSKGIVCIVGTGSNVAFFDGINIQKHTGSLGYVLGDEGSATYICKKFLRKYLRGDFSEPLQLHFNGIIKDDESDILKKIYAEEMPNKYIASFFPVLYSKIDEKEIKLLVKEAIRDFIENHILKIPDYFKFNIGFCGSVSFLLKEMIEECCSEYSLSEEIEFLKRPFDKIENFLIYNKLV